MPRVWLSLNEAGLRLGTSYQWVQQLIEACKLKGYRIVPSGGGRVFTAVDEDEVQKFKDGQCRKHRP